MPHHVFISYSTKDKVIADAVYAMLQGRGIRCWIASEDIPPGRDWAEAIMEALSTTRVMVLVFSSNANDSPQVRREVQRAFENRVTVIPFRVEDVAPARAMEYYIGSVNWMNAFTPPMEKHLECLAGAVQSLIAASNPPSAEAETPGAGSPWAAGTGSTGRPELRASPLSGASPPRPEVSPGASLNSPSASASPAGFAPSVDASAWKAPPGRVASPALQRPEAPGRLESDARRPVPEEIKGLNWGALLLNFFWAIGNQVRVGLLCLVPGVGICVAFYLLFRGNELAWQGPRKWQSVAEFKAVQTAWTKWSIGLLTAYIVLWLAYGAGLPRSPLLAFSIIAITVILFLAWKRRVR